MKPIKVLHMYADILDLYGDSGNMEILSYRWSDAANPVSL